MNFKNIREFKKLFVNFKKCFAFRKCPQIQKKCPWILKIFMDLKHILNYENVHEIRNKSWIWNKKIMILKYVREFHIQKFSTTSKCSIREFWDFYWSPLVNLVMVYISPGLTWIVHMLLEQNRLVKTMRAL